ncbi:MAG: NPCBM/NEW2 domain-containing protein [Verrucomicrobiales bacterium]|nr:NPCBM/NEW2 domain-containing protein [Verrucomicrobiales bacterium]
MKALSCSLALLCLAMTTSLMATPKKIVFISHLSSHGNGQHEYGAGCQLIGQWLTAAYGEDKVTWEHHIIWPEEPETAFKDADTVVFFCSGGNGHLVNKHVKEFDKVMKRGVGLACLHYGVEVPVGPPGKGMLNWMGGYFEAHWSVNPHWIAEFKEFPKHPAAAGLKPFTSNDEWYFHMRFRPEMEGITPILSAHPPAKTMERKDGAHSGNPHVRKSVADGNAQHVAWTYQRGEDYGNGRGFGFTGLHYHKNFTDDSFRKTALNGIAWTAQLGIPEGGVPSPRPTEADLAKSITDTVAKFPKHTKPKKKAKKKQAANKNATLPKSAFSSKTVTEDTPGHAVKIEADITGAKQLYLAVTDGGDSYSFDWANWINPRVVGPKGEKKLTKMKWAKAESGWGQTRLNQNAGGGNLIVAGKRIKEGIGTHATSLITYNIPNGYTKFRATGGLDEGGTEQGGASSVAFHVFTKDPQDFIRQETRKSGGGGDDLRDPANAVASLDVHPELDATLFASEPMLMSPSSIDVDHLGRVWVCEVINYRGHKGKRKEGDRILIIEDTDADGKADKSTVFYQGNDVDSAHGICVLGDRVIVSANDDVFSLYDDNKDGKADRKELMFTKIGGSQHDHGIHAFMFGHDGRLYFILGNAAKRLCDKDGELIVDLAGNEVAAKRKPYQEGMIFRCALDGSNVETLAWNFRNNWEMAVDSYGAMWQSDNDDDGNRGVRINFVMEYGNYGYRDELTGAGWRSDRIGAHTDTPLKHWHLRDPGVVPNLLQTGAGSPTGITIYEGDLLPKQFHGQVIHCDAGPNVCRAYPVENDGAGYKAESVNILSSTKDRWYRPSDVAVAPDGSLIIADWYDPGVGGHGMGDLDRGRLFRVAPKGNTTFQIYKVDTSTTEGAIAALKSPNNATRYLGWTALSKDKAGRKAARTLFRNKEALPHHRARGLHLLGWHKKGYVKQALKNSDPNIRMAGLRLARQHNSHLLESIETLTEDPDSQVRRECAIALRFQDSPIANELWAKLAAQHDGKDRWYLEALGIGADLYWDSRLAAFEALDHQGLGSADILWRSRATSTPGKLADALLKEASAEKQQRLIRALDFQTPGKAKDAALAKAFAQGSEQIALPIAFNLPPDSLTSEQKSKVSRLVSSLKDKPEAVRLIARFNFLKPTTTSDILLSYILKQEQTNSDSILAARSIVRTGAWGWISEHMRGAQLKAITGNDYDRLIHALGSCGEAVDILKRELLRNYSNISLCQKLIAAIALSPNGERFLLKEAKSPQFRDELKFTTAAVLGRSRDRKIRDSIAKALDLPPTPGAEKFPPIPKLVQMKGRADQGAAAFAKATCTTCHLVDEKGIDFGPDLTEIGDKLSVEGLYEAILYPNNAVSHGFQGVVLTTKDETQLGGYLVRETDSGLALRMPGGVTQTLALSDIKKREDMPQSLMPPGLAATLSTQELANLVAYLSTLKK